MRKTLSHLEKEKPVRDLADLQDMMKAHEVDSEVASHPVMALVSRVMDSLVSDYIVSVVSVVITLSHFM